MLDFVIFKIIVIIGAIAIFFAGLIEFRKKFQYAIKNENVKDVKDMSLKIILFYLEVFISMIIMGGLLSLFVIFPNNALLEFAFNFNEVTDNYYKEVNKEELLKKAFNAVINELDDKYTEVLNERFVEDLKNNIDSEYGYSIIEQDNGVYIDGITEKSIEEMGLKRGDKLVCINDIEVLRIKY